MTTYIERQSDARVDAPTHWITGVDSAVLSLSVDEIDPGRVSQHRPIGIDATPASLFRGVYYMLDILIDRYARDDVADR